MTEERIHDLFREMRDEPVPADSLVRVRAVVAERAESWQRRVLRHWRIAAAILMPACAVLFAMWVHVPVKTPSRAPVAAVNAAPSMQASVSETPPPRIKRAPIHRVAHRAPRRSDPGISSTVIRIETPDPNVVILLVGG